MAACDVWYTQEVKLKASLLKGCESGEAVTAHSSLYSVTLSVMFIWGLESEQGCIVRHQVLKPTPKLQASTPCSLLHVLLCYCHQVNDSTKQGGLSI